MRKTLTVCALTLLTTIFSVNAQDDVVVDDASAMPVSFGVKAGLNLATFSGGDSEVAGADKGMRMGLIGGAFLSLGIANSVTIQPELLYSQKGAKYSDASDELVFKANNIDVPVFIKFNFPTDGSMVPSVFVGPQLSMKLGDVSAELNGTELPDSLFNADVYKSTHFGVTFGAGLGFATGASGTFGVEGRYALGLSDVVEDAEVKSNVISLLAFFSFR